MRPATILAIARRDLRMELRGARGLLFGGLTAALLLPASAVPVGGSTRVPLPVLTQEEVRVAGSVPEGLAEEVHVDETAPTRIEPAPDGAHIVQGPIPDALRTSLDALDTHPVAIEVVTKPFPMPGRTLFLALISSSIMMGALSESLAGERARRTLSTLLAAAVSREEIVAGKWLAWTGYGASAALIAAFAAVASGSTHPGLWLLPLPLVPAATVALGLYLVRRARDVVAGATISLRVLPAALMTLGIAAWFLGRAHPLLGASVPLGGALLAAGDTWPGVAPPVLSALVTGLGTWFLLAATARDLSDDPGGETKASPQRELATVGTIALAAWWAPTLGPLLWGMAGNDSLTQGLEPQTGAVAGGAGLALLAALRVSRNGLSDGLIAAPRGKLWVLALCGVAAVLGGQASGLTLEASSGGLASAQGRLASTLQVSGLAAILTVALGQELVFRGLLQRAVGPLVATCAFSVVVTPHDPLHGLAMGAPLAVAVHATGSVWTAVVGRALALAVGSVAAGIPVVLSLLGALVLAAVASRLAGDPPDSLDAADLLDVSNDARQLGHITD